MESIEEFCTDIIILNRGKTVLKGNLNKIRNEYPSNKMEVHSNKDIKDLISKLKLEIINDKDNEYEIKIQDEKEADGLFKEIAKNDIHITKFELKKPSLNDIFIEKVGEQK